MDDDRDDLMICDLPAKVMKSRGEIYLLTVRHTYMLYCTGIAVAGYSYHASRLHVSLLL